MRSSGLVKDLHIALRRTLPNHRAAAGVSKLTHRISSRMVSKQSRDFGTDFLGIVKWHQNAAALRQQLLGMPIWRRDDRFTQPKTVGQRARCHLGFVKIRRDVNIAHRDEVEQRRLIDKPVEKNDMILNAERAYAR